MAPYIHPYFRSAAAPKPTLKADFHATAHSTFEGTGKVQQKKSTCDKLCSGNFGCTNVAFFKDNSGTLYCKDHKPKQVPGAPIFVEKKNL